ncbi:MAG: xanthine dehydrogenase accessory protein XdhC [Deltaproteobacteria bacterium]|nr:xanthine dehydrogenase accessory protein XdhC [Deltaproteobacteria bacterium]
MTQLWNQLVESLSRDRPFAMVTVVETTGSAPQSPGARMLVYEDGSIVGTVGGGAVEHRLIREGREVLDDGRPRLLTFDLAKDVGMICGGRMVAFVEPMLSSFHVVIFGCGHVCRALAPLLVGLDFRVTVVDDRPEWADSSAFPSSVRVVCGPLRDYWGTLARLDRTAVLAMTRSHAFDYELLEHFVTTSVPYVGIMASRSKAAQFRERLAAAGIPREQVDRVRMPVGIPIGGSSVAEIAVSIAAQLVERRACGFAPEASA